jgi:glycosyltransferase involved in cell wall biosynthesis
MRVCLFGAYDPAYPRHRILQQGLERAGVAVVECRVRETRAFRRLPALASAFGRVGRDADVILVPEFRHKDVPLARLLAGHRRLVFDPLVSRVDTLVDDWGLHAPGSAQARWNRWIDRLSLSQADVVLCDTWAHGRLFETLGVPRAKLRRVLVGAEDAFFAIGPAPAGAEVQVLYLGGFLPLHGVAHLLDALALLEARAGLPPFTVTLAGRGIEWEAAQESARGKGLRRVRFPGRVDYAAAPELFGAAHIVLGAFGAGEKAGRVIPHKVYQGLAAGRAVLTGDGEGLREVFEPGVHLDAVPRGDPAALAAALERLIGDSGRRSRLAADGRRRAREVASVEPIARELLAAIGAAA